MFGNILIGQSILSEKNKITRSAKSGVISRVYKEIEPEIDSLRLYDAGKKKINARNLKNTVRSIQGAV